MYYMLIGVLLLLFLIVALASYSRNQMHNVVSIASIDYASSLAALSRIENAETASAKVLALSYPLEPGKLQGTKNDFINIILKLEVLPPIGDFYRVEVWWEVNKFFLNRINAGYMIKIKIDSLDQQIIYPYGNWARYIGDNSPKIVESNKHTDANCSTSNDSEKQIADTDSNAAFN